MSECTPSYHCEECEGDCGAQALYRRKPKHPGGRPQGVTMPCGWKCGAKLTARGMRMHFTICPKRPDDPAKAQKEA